MRNVVIDIETTGLSPWKGDKCVGVAIGVPAEGLWEYVPPGDLESDWMEQWLDGADQLVLHNCLFDIGFLVHEGHLAGWPEIPVYDTMTAQWLQNECGPLALKKIAADLWGTDITTEQKRIKELMKARCWKCEGTKTCTIKGVKYCKACRDDYGVSTWQPKRQIGELDFNEIKPYAIKDIELTWRLYCHQQDIKDHEFDAAMEREMAVVKEVFGMTQRGVALDRTRMSVAVVENMKALHELEEQIPVNPRSPKQVRDWLIEEGVKIGDSTDVDALLPLQKHEAVKGLLAHRKLAKIGGYFKTYHDCVGLDGRLHPRFRPQGTVSGRFSCSEPNLQQMPRSGPVKECLAPDEGMVFVTADLSQAELRVAAAYSRCTNLLAMFERNEDVYQAFAEKAGVDRQTGKIVVLSSLYGVGARKLRKILLRGGIDLRESECRRLLDEYFELFPELKWLQGASERKAYAQGRIKILVPGRYRHFPRGQKYPTNPKDAMNNLVQGTVAELMKTWMLTLAPECERLGVVMCLQVHDSLVFQVPEGKVGVWQTKLLETWEALNPFDVPMPVEVKVGL